MEIDELKELLRAVAYDAHMEGRIYNRRNEPGSPAEVCDQLDRMIDHKCKQTGIADKLAGIDPPTDYPQVMAFARAMLFKLRKNAHKDGWLRPDGRRSWEGIDQNFLVRKLMEEVGELLEALNIGALDAIRHEAGDVGNIAMMLADNAGALDDPQADKT